MSNLWGVSFRSAYEAKLKGSGKEEDFYYYGADIEEEMSEVLAAYDDYIESGQKAEEMEQIREQLKREGLI